VRQTGDPREDGVEAFGYRQELKRSLNFTDLLVYGLIFMVSSASTASPPSRRRTGTPRARSAGP
jgi:hypothetical protein